MAPKRKREVKKEYGVTVKVVMMASGLGFSMLSNIVLIHGGGALPSSWAETPCAHTETGVGLTPIQWLLGFSGAGLFVCSYVGLCCFSCWHDEVFGTSISFRLLLLAYALFLVIWDGIGGAVFLSHDGIECLKSDFRAVYGMIYFSFILFLLSAFLIIGSILYCVSSLSSSNSTSIFEQRSFVFHGFFSFRMVGARFLYWRRLWPYWIKRFLTAIKAVIFLAPFFVTSCMWGSPDIFFGFFLYGLVVYASSLFAFLTRAVFLRIHADSFSGSKASSEVLLYNSVDSFARGIEKPESIPKDAVIILNVRDRLDYFPPEGGPWLVLR
jgi:hypothetical protein